ncbi:MAG TPA: HAD-IA family hydrolase [Ktedonobacteraceae bacterium]|nr:HAD-IA family hydrolase [Ktedonobacteraceae bacterium]
MKLPILFIDDGGVMNDNSRRAAQWQCLVGEFFVPLLGGTQEAWQAANRVVADGLFEPESWRRRVEAAVDYEDFDRAYHWDWLDGMCKLVGVPTPMDEWLPLTHRATTYICSRVHATFPGAVEALRRLKQQGYQLHTASGESSFSLEGSLAAMGVRDCFGALYGPDLVNTLKERPDYYERVFAAADVTPGDAIVVDDIPSALMQAAQLGARTILVGKQPHPEVATITVESLAVVPEMLYRFV